MDFINDIVEHEVEAPSEPIAIAPTGFPATKQFTAKKLSRWSQNKMKQKRGSAPKRQSEAERIHEENIKKIASMTMEEVAQEREELLRELDPKLIQSLLKKTQKRSQADQYDDSFTEEEKSQRDKELKRSEGYDGWIGQKRTSQGLQDLSKLDEDDVNRALGISKQDDEYEKNLVIQDDEDLYSINKPKKSKKSVSFDTIATVKYEDLPEDVPVEEKGWEDIEDLNEMFTGVSSEEIAPDDYQLTQDENKLGVHFTKPKSHHDEFDLNDPEFYNKLHEKYYPDLPKETDKLKWMTEPLPKQVSTTYESISDMRFDFDGNLINIDEKSADIPTFHGLHHHSEDPQLAGYTLSELSRLSRSVVPGQRCIAIRTLGRILYKLGKHQFNILPINEEDDQSKEFNDNMQQVLANFENLVWDLIEELRIIESITEASNEKKTKNVSVNNYAIESLYLWKQGGGRPKMKTGEENIIEILQN